MSTESTEMSYRTVYAEAARQADRELWEYVEEDALHDALSRHDFGTLLDRGELMNINGWLQIDVSDDGEPADRRWYYPTGDEPRPTEFKRFHELLMSEAPTGYVPHYFKVRRCSKAPATQFGSWKHSDARLSLRGALQWMQKGGNVGIAGRGPCENCTDENEADCPICEGTPVDDALVNVDIDDDEETTPDDVPPSLRARSRSRTGWHTWYFNESGDVPNVPTDEYGEIRTDWQYVVAPGSFVASVSDEIPADATDAGYYTVADAEPVAQVTYDDLPEVFHDIATEAAENAETIADGEVVDDIAGASLTPADSPALDTDASDTSGKSGVFDIDATDIIGNRSPSDRFDSVFHGSDTGANMSVSRGRVHCWRHHVAHGGLQTLAVLSNEINYGCREVGTAHGDTNKSNHSDAGPCVLKNDWRLIWAAWHEAKVRGEIPTDDPVPFRALLGIAVRDGLIDEDEIVRRDADTGTVVADPDSHAGDTYRGFPEGTYNSVLEHFEATYSVDHGREHVRGDASEYYGANLHQVADTHGLTDIRDDDEALLRACLHARDADPSLADADPPYRALIAVADMMAIDYTDTLSKSDYKVASRVYDDLDAGDI